MVLLVQFLQLRLHGVLLDTVLQQHLVELLLTTGNRPLQRLFPRVEIDELDIALLLPVLHFLQTLHCISAIHNYRLQIESEFVWRIVMKSSLNMLLS